MLSLVLLKKAKFNIFIIIIMVNFVEAMEMLNYVSNRDKNLQDHRDL